MNKRYLLLVTCFCVSATPPVFRGTCTKPLPTLSLRQSSLGSSFNLNNNETTKKNVYLRNLRTLDANQMDLAYMNKIAIITDIEFPFRDLFVTKQAVLLTPYLLRYHFQ